MPLSEPSGGAGQHDWVLYINDDMVAAPGWDIAFAEGGGIGGYRPCSVLWHVDPAENGGLAAISLSRTSVTRPQTLRKLSFCSTIWQMVARQGGSGFAAHSGAQKMVEHGRRIQSGI